ncbi:MAG: hypothetical protein LQ340_004547 [Diploschistes diacapsis]|nr:MAG: hypothetical protein LQ340_004547 [Diploschistes diacapsis]
MKAVWPRAAFNHLSRYGAEQLSATVATRKTVDTSIWVCQQCRGYKEPSKAPRWRHPPFKKLLSSSNHQSSLRYPDVRHESTSTDTSATQGKPSSTTRSDLPSTEEGRRSHLSKRFAHVMDHLQSNIFLAGQRLNDLTGYSGIEALKKEIEEQGKPPSFSPLLPLPKDTHRYPNPATLTRPTHQRLSFNKPANPSKKPKNPTPPPSPLVPPRSAKSTSSCSANTRGRRQISSASPPSTAPTTPPRRPSPKRRRRWPRPRRRPRRRPRS